MENKLTPELIKKAKQAKSAEELIALAKENGIELSEAEAKACFERLAKSGEVSDEELGNVSGGGCSSSEGECPKCHSNSFKGGICSNCGYHDFLIM